MGTTTLHITNSNNLTEYLQELHYEGHFLTWQEMMCEGPTAEEVDSEQFFELRKQFLADYYDIEINEDELKSELDVLNHSERFDDIVLWFDFDVSSHINLMAIIRLLKQKKVELPMFLVCCGRVKGEKDLKILTELKPEQLHQHYETKIPLSKEALDLMSSLWKIYCGKDHNLLKPFITKKSAFPYLSSCLKAHLQRFPDSKTGFSTLEFHTLHMIADQHIKSKRHLLGYLLNFQGYYGFGDLQLHKMIARLDIFYNEQNNLLELNEKGKKAFEGLTDFSGELKSQMVYGGVKKQDFRFDKNQNKLIKTKE